MRRGLPLLWIILVLVPGPGCGDDDPFPADAVNPPADTINPPSDAACTVLFGVPNEKTGLTADQCQPMCDCEGRRFEPPTYGEAEIASILAMVHLEPLASLTEDPYADPDLPDLPPATVCAVVLGDSDPGVYTLRTFNSPDAARADGARITHEGPCGLCSPLVDLVVYMRQPDLTDPVRDCGIAGMIQGREEHMRCLMDLGFSEPCASIWYYNTRHTQEKCGAICIKQISDPYHRDDGSLNDCLQCDEDESGPVFKAYAGRTRRNTGLPSSMCRPCTEVLPIVHDYAP
jgi:hypothetical protein